MSETVSLVRCHPSTEDSLRRALEPIHGIDPRGLPVIIKPNLCTGVDRTGAATTRVEIVEVVVEETIRVDQHARVVIVEADSDGKNADKAFVRLGYRRLESRLRNKGYDVSLVNLSHERQELVQVDGLHFRELSFPKILLEPKFFVSLAVPKIHELTEITGALKNQFGCLPRKDKKVYHPNIDRVIVDVNRLIQPNLCIIDGRVGLEGVTRGNTVDLGVMIAGRSAASTDAVTARVMKFDPEKIEHLRLSQDMGLGSLHPEVVGERVESVAKKFHRPSRIVSAVGRRIPNHFLPLARAVYYGIAGLVI